MKVILPNERSYKCEKQLKKVWFVEICENSGSLESILSFLLQEYIRIFGIETMAKEKCVVFNDPKADVPMLITNEKELKIRLAQESLLCFAQSIYQLSHELCHYAIRQHKTDKMSTIKWFEEIVSEAMSLYALDYSIENWTKCPLYGSNITFSKAIEDYRDEVLSEQLPSTDVLRNCRTIQDLKKLEPFAEPNRETHRIERDELYYEIKKDPLKCKYLCDYQNYILPGTDVAINFDRWERDVNEPIIKCVHSFQRIDIFEPAV